MNRLHGFRWDIVENVDGRRNNDVCLPILQAHLWAFSSGELTTAGAQPWSGQKRITGDFKTNLAAFFLAIQKTYVQVCGTPITEHYRLKTILVITATKTNMSRLMRLWHIALSKLNLQTCMRSNPLGLIFDQTLHNFHTLYVRTAMAEPSLFAYAIRTIISWAGSSHELAHISLSITMPVFRELTMQHIQTSCEGKIFCLGYFTNIHWQWWGDYTIDCFPPCRNVLISP